MIIYKTDINSNFKMVDQCVRTILAKMKDVETLSDEDLLFKVSFVLRELMNNSVEHGHHFDNSKLIHCCIDYESPYLKLTVSDQGEGLDMEDAYYESLDNDMRERRRGLKLIEALGFKIRVNKTTVALTLEIE